jgi:hypothetical protein
MRNQVLHFFRNLPESYAEQFNKAFELYRQSEGKSLSTERSYNAQGYTTLSLGNLLYDLQKLHSISDLEKLPVDEPETKQDLPLASKMIQVIAGMDFGMANSVVLALKMANEYSSVMLFSLSPEIDKFVNDIEAVFGQFVNGFRDELHELEESECIDLMASLIEQLPEPYNSIDFPPEIKNELQELSKKFDQSQSEDDLSAQDPAPDSNEAFSLRTQYPFLNDPDCPNELKILVTDKITHYNKYRVAHDQLQQHAAGELELNPEEVAALTKSSVGSFEANEAIGLELEHYKEHKELLGQHPIFSDLALKREVEKMSPEELHKFKEQTPSYISKKNKALKEAATDKRKLELQMAIDNRNAKLALVDKKLGINAS